MEFYTSCIRFGNKLLYRGYKNGHRVQERVAFKPTLFVPNPESEILALDGKRVSPIQLEDMAEARDFVSQYKDMDSYKVYGNTNYVVQYLQEKFPGAIQFDPDMVNIGFYDIEVMKTEDGYSDPKDANNPINAIAYRNNQEDKYYFWYLKEWDKSKSELNLQDMDVEYFYCPDEYTLLKSFVTWWSTPKNTPDIISGWNCRFFDTPYTINRIYKILGEEYANRLSPWKRVNAREIEFNGRKQQFYDIVGITELDYLEVYKKFTYTAQESYKLDHIAHVELGEKKLSYDEYKDLQDLYEQDPQKFGDYNIKDVGIVYQLDDKMGLINLAMTLAYRGGVNYTDTLGTTAIWDAIIYRDLADKGIVVQPNVEKQKVAFAGGYVKAPKVGMHDWVVSFDLNSLYPHIIMQCQMSPETIVDDKIIDDRIKEFSNSLEEIERLKKLRNVINDLKSSSNDRRIARLLNKEYDTTGLKDLNLSLAANGTLYRKDKQGIIPAIIEQIYAERKVTKKKMLKASQELVNIENEMKRRGIL